MTTTDTELELIVLPGLNEPDVRCEAVELDGSDCPRNAEWYVKGHDGNHQSNEGYLCSSCVEEQHMPEMLALGLVCVLHQTPMVEELRPI